MTMAWLDHVNIRTANLDAVSRFYGDILGLPKGPRPPFGFPGAWHYCGDKAVVHLIGVDKAPLGKDPKIEHFAFRSTGLADFVAHLRKKKVEHNAVRVPLTGIIQINVQRPGVAIRTGDSMEGIDMVCGAFKLSCPRDSLFEAILDEIGSWADLPRWIFVQVHYAGKSVREVAAQSGFGIQEVSRILETHELKLRQSLRDYRVRYLLSSTHRLPMPANTRPSSISGLP